MDILIACNDHAIVKALRACLSKLGIECGQSQVLSHESALLTASNFRKGQSGLVFFGSPQLASDDLTALGRLCGAAADRFKVVVVGHNLAAESILRAVRSGAIDCLCLDGALEVELRHLLDRHRSSSDDRDSAGQLFTVVSPVGGVGASMLAANLAVVIAARQRQCGLLDLHWRGGDLATLLNISPAHTLLSLATKTEQLDRSMLDQSLASHSSGVRLLASPEPFSDYRQIRPELIVKIVQLARAAFATVVVDLEDCEHPDQVRTVAVSDRIIVPMRPDFISLVRAKKLLRHLTAAHVAQEHITVVVNRTGQPKELSLAQLAEGLGMPVRHHIPDDPVTSNAAINLGVPLALAFPQSKAVDAIERLADSLPGLARESVPRPAGQRRLSRQQIPESLKIMANWFGAVQS